MTRHGLLVRLAAVAVAAMPAQAQPAPTTVPGAAAESQLPAATQVIATFIEAIGGRAAVLNHTSRRLTGTFEIPGQGLSGSFDMLSARPNKTRVVIELPAVGAMVTGFDGEVAWLVNPMTGPMLLEGTQLDQTKADADFDVVLHEGGYITSMETIERVSFEGRPCYLVRVSRASGEKDLEYYETGTGLLVGAVTERETPMGTVTSTQTFGEYRAFGRLRLPTRTTLKLAGLEQVMMIKIFEFDSVDPGAFEPPADIKALLKGRPRSPR